MALLPIPVYPDPRLHTVARPVQAVDARIKKLIEDMIETMYEANGIGLAATQVDVHERVVVVDLSEGPNQPRVLINPESYGPARTSRSATRAACRCPGSMTASSARPR